MGDGSLSQEEIDALLNMGGEADATPDPGSITGTGGAGNADTSMGLGADDLSALTSSLGASMPTPTTSLGSTPTPRKSPGDAKDNVDLLLDVMLRFRVELGRTEMLIKDVMRLTEGSIVELDKNVGDEVDIYINDRLFGRGTLVVIDEYFGVQITHILDPMERFRNL